MAKSTSTPPKQAIANVDPSIPEYLRALQANGPVNLRDNFDASDVTVPKVKLLQGLSKECEAFDDAKPGNFWHTGLDVALGPEIDFVICSRRKKFLLVAPMEDGQGILARSEDTVKWDRLGKWQVKIKGVKNPVTWEIGDLDVAKSGLTEWGTFNPDDENSPPAATLFYEYLIILPDRLDLGPAVLSLARSAIVKAKKGLNEKIALHAGSGRPMESLVFRAKSTEDKNADGQAFKNFQFVGNGFASEAVFKQAVEIGKAMSNYKVQDEGDEAVEQGSKAATSDKF